MIRFPVLAMLCASLAGCMTAGASSSDAQPDRSLAAGHANMPPSAPRNPNACIHDEGYGRWTDCGAEM